MNPLVLLTPDPMKAFVTTCEWMWLQQSYLPRSTGHPGGTGMRGEGAHWGPLHSGFPSPSQVSLTFEVKIHKICRQLSCHRDGQTAQKSAPACDGSPSSVLDSRRTASCLSGQMTGETKHTERERGVQWRRLRRGETAAH